MISSSIGDGLNLEDDVLFLDGGMNLEGGVFFSVEAFDMWHHALKWHHCALRGRLLTGGLQHVFRGRYIFFSERHSTV